VFSNIPDVCYSPKLKYKVLNPYKTTGKLVTYSAALTLSDSRRGNEGSELEW
jgi:hypothetical protein